MLKNWYPLPKLVTIHLLYLALLESFMQAYNPGPYGFVLSHCSVAPSVENLLEKLIKFFVEDVSTVAPTIVTINSNPILQHMFNVEVWNFIRRSTTLFHTKYAKNLEDAYSDPEFYLSFTKNLIVTTREFLSILRLSENSANALSQVEIKILFNDLFENASYVEQNLFAELLSTVVERRANVINYFAAMINLIENMQKDPSDEHKIALHKFLIENSSEENSANIMLEVCKIISSLLKLGKIYASKNDIEDAVQALEIFQSNVLSPLRIFYQQLQRKSCGQQISAYACSCIGLHTSDISLSGAMKFCMGMQDKVLDTLSNIVQTFMRHILSDADSDCTSETSSTISKSIVSL